MHSTILLLASLLPISFAIPNTNSVARQAAVWSITNYDPGCGDDPAGCLYTFDLSSQSPTPFSTSCEGTDVPNDTFGSCTLPSVTSHEVAEVGEFTTLFINYTYAVANVVYLYTGSVNIPDFGPDGQSFTVVPTVTVTVNE